jgi:hypothetical protein
MWAPDDHDLRYEVFLDCHLFWHVIWVVIKLMIRFRGILYWKCMSQDIVDFVQKCHVCQLHKGRQHSKYGYLQPLAIPTRPFYSISLDLLSGLPLTPLGHVAIITVVDSLLSWSL